MARSGRSLDPDTRLEVRLDGAAIRFAYELRPVPEAVAALQEMAGGRTDLMARAAGSILGGYLGSPAMHHPGFVLAAGLLVLAGADPDRIVEHLEVARRHMHAPRYGTP